MLLRLTQQPTKIGLFRRNPYGTTFYKKLPVTPGAFFSDSNRDYLKPVRFYNYIYRQKATTA